MSLINDALKQAGEHQKKNPPPPSPLQFRTADESPRRSYTPSALLLGVLLVALALGGVLIGLALQKKSDVGLVVNARHEESPVAPPAEPVTPARAPVVQTAPPAVAPLPTPVIGAVPAAARATPPATETNSDAAPVEPPKPVEPKLQGISYSPARPSAVVNGRTVYAGDPVGEFRVTQITPGAVTLTGATGETKVLSLSR